MTGEYAPKAIEQIYHDAKRYAPDLGLQLGGIVGNGAHVFGYHRARAALLAHGESDDYSIQLDDDKRGDPWACDAIDLTPKDADGMKTLTNRLKAAVESRDPRLLNSVREFAGTLDGQHVFAMDVRTDRRVDGFDDSHLWHVHLSIIRKFSNDVQRMAGIAQVLGGVPLDPNAGGKTGSPAQQGKRYPLPPGSYFGLLTGPSQSHGGGRRRDRIAIRRIQKRLNTLGFGPLDVDGYFGKDTENAVAAWQKATRAAQTTRYGEVWRDDWQALF